MKGGGERVMDWIWRQCNMAFESGVVPEDWRSPLCIGKGERTECINYRDISLLSVVAKIYEGIQIEFVK